jgi:hypothetical protein
MSSDRGRRPPIGKNTVTPKTEVIRKAVNLEIMA